MQEHPLRRTLSDELHARAFHDFDGAGRVIRFVFLVGNDDRAAVSYINEFMVKNRLPALEGGTNF